MMPLLQLVPFCWRPLAKQQELLDSRLIDSNSWNALHGTNTVKQKYVPTASEMRSRSQNLLAMQEDPVVNSAYSTRVLSNVVK